MNKMNDFYNMNQSPLERWRFLMQFIMRDSFIKYLHVAADKSDIIAHRNTNVSILPVLNYSTS